MKIIHFINALGSGGAEKVMYDTINGLDKEFTQEVLVLSVNGIYRDKLGSAGISVRKLTLKILMQFLFEPKKNTIIHSYLYRSHAISLIFWLMGYRVLWSVHGSFYGSPGLFKRAVGVLSKFVPQKIIYVSKYCSEQHNRIGYCKLKEQVIHNGIDTDSFRRSKLSDIDSSLVPETDAIKIAMVCRFHPIKNYKRFFEIASEFVKMEPSVCFYLIGEGNEKENNSLGILIREYSLGEKVVLLGEIENIAGVYKYFDLVVSTSNSESFGLTVLEAIASGVNVSTIGLPVIDELLGIYSTNEPTCDNVTIAQNWLEKTHATQRAEVIEYICKRFSLNNMVGSYSQLYKGLQ
jgi:glycosyltransferase involved in cell wall biosynthesis